MIKLLSIFVMSVVLASAGHAFEIQEVTSSKGIKAWLVEAHDIPIVTMQFSFDGARDLEVAGKEGSLGILTSALKEGAGTLSAAEIKSTLSKMTSNFGFYATADNTSGQLQTLTKNLDATARLLKASLESPRFEAAGLERLRDEVLQDVARAATDQSSIAEDAWYALAFPKHLYGTSSRGTAQSLKTITADDLRALWTRIANRRGLDVVIVGDITPTQVERLLDHVFGNLPDFDVTPGAQVTVIAKGPIEKRISYDNPQTVVYFGTPATAGNGRDAWASYVIAEIMGGRAGFAKLNQSLREKSGLTYGVYMSDATWEFADIQYGSFSTATETTEQALKILRKELADMAKNGPTVEELRKIKSYINGAFPLGFSDNNSIAGELLDRKQRGRTPAYFNERANLINAVTLDDVKAEAAKLLRPENQIVVVVGRNP